MARPVSAGRRQSSACNGRKAAGFRGSVDSGPGVSVPAADVYSRAFTVIIVGDVQERIRRGRGDGTKTAELRRSLPDERPLRFTPLSDRERLSCILEPESSRDPSPKGNGRLTGSVGHAETGSDVRDQRARATDASLYGIQVARLPDQNGPSVCTTGKSTVDPDISVGDTPAAVQRSGGAWTVQLRRSLRSCAVRSDGVRNPWGNVFRSSRCRRKRRERPGGRDAQECSP